MRLLFVALVGHALDNGSGHMVTFPLRSPHPGWPGLENVRDTHDAAGLVCAGLALHTVAQRFGCPVNRVPGAVVALACLLGLTRWPDLQMAGRTVRFRLAFAGRFVRITYTLVPWTRLARPAIVGL